MMMVMPLLCIAALSGVLFLLWFASREKQSDLDALLKRLTALEVALDALKTEQDKLAQEWGTIFSSQQKAWDKHIDKITQEVTVQLALGSRVRRNRR